MHFSTVTIALLTGSAMASHLAIRIPEPYSRLRARQGGCAAVEGVLKPKGLSCCSNDGTSYLVCPASHSHCTTGDNKAWCCPQNQQDCPRKACSDNNGGCDPNQYTCDDNKGCVPKDYSKVMQMFAATPNQPQNQDQQVQSAATQAANDVSSAVAGAAGDASSAATSAASEASQAVVDAATSASSAVAEATSSAEANATETTTTTSTGTQETAPAATGAASTLGGVSSLVVAIMAVVFIL